MMEDLAHNWNKSQKGLLLASRHPSPLGFTTDGSTAEVCRYSDIFHISAQNLDCGYSLEPTRRGGSNEYLQSMFLSRNKKNTVYPCKPQFYYINVGFKGFNFI